VDVTLADMNANMMQGGPMMTVSVTSPTTPAGEVSFRVSNAGRMVHEMVVLPLAAGASGRRPAGSGGRVDEAGSLGEASNSCAAGAGSGIAPGAVGWVTVRLAPGRYELICNEPNHYAMGMFTELDTV
jgi:uncharacterized cupredoxin-like copper-binding protein